jgi:hypothetical protein
MFRHATLVVIFSSFVIAQEDAKQDSECKSSISERSLGDAFDMGDLSGEVPESLSLLQKSAKAMLKASLNHGVEGGLDVRTSKQELWPTTHEEQQLQIFARDLLRRFGFELNNSGNATNSTKTLRCVDHSKGYMSVLIQLGPLSIVLALVLIVPTVIVVMSNTDKRAEESINSGSPEDMPATGAPTQNEIASQKEIYPPTVLRWLCLTGNTLLMSNFTIIMPASAKAASSHDSSVAFSGLVIGIYALGATLSLPMMRWYAKNSFRAGMISMACTGAIGNALYASAGYISGPAGAWMLIIARLVCGLEGGTVCVFYIALLSTTRGPTARAQQMADVTLASSVGLILGPTLSSLTRLIAGKGVNAEVPPAIFMICMAIGFGTLAACAAPTQEECFIDETGDDKKVAQQYKREKIVFTPDELKASWLSMWLNSVTQCIRYFQRVFWEAAILYIFEHEYGFSSIEAGFLEAIPMLPLLGLPWFGPYVYRTWGYHNYVRVVDVGQVVGLFGMIRWGGPPNNVSLVFLMVASAFFCFCNWASGMAHTVYRAQLAVPDHWALSVEGGVVIQWVVTYIGYFGGPIMARSVLGACDFQNLLPMSLGFTLAGYVVGCEMMFCAMHGYTRLKK